MDKDSIYEKYQLKRVINASGKMTILGVSTIKDEVIMAMQEGATHFFEMDALLNKTGEYIAELLESEAAYIVSSASAGIAMSVASLIAKDNLDAILNLHNRKENLPNEVILQKGHNIDYGAPVQSMIELGGGKVREAGYSNQCKPAHVESLINEKTVALMYIKSHHCVQKGMIRIEDMISIGKKYDIPVIIDAAAEEDLRKYFELGADLVIYSGAKSIEGPTSGLVVGRKKYIENLKRQAQGIGRAMKVGKESILGLTKAIEIYESAKKITLDQSAMRLEKFVNDLNELKGIDARIVRDDAGRDILRAEIFFNEAVLKKNALDVVKALKEGAIAVYTRDYRANEGRIEIDIRSVSDEELKFIYEKLVSLIKGK